MTLCPPAKRFDPAEKVKRGIGSCFQNPRTSAPGFSQAILEIGCDEKRLCGNGKISWLEPRLEKKKQLQGNPGGIRGEGIPAHPSEDGQ